MRANHKDFNVSIHEQYEEGLPQMMVIPQDLSRAILNITNNALYAVWKKSQSAPEDYKPEVSIGVSRQDNNCIIKMTDNGVGMSDEVKQKLFECATSLRTSIMARSPSNQRRAKVPVSHSQYPSQNNKCHNQPLRSSSSGFWIHSRRMKTRLLSLTRMASDRPHIKSSSQWLAEWQVTYSRKIIPLTHS